MSDNETTSYAISDDTISAVLKIVQFGFLSATDVTDYFRRLRLTVNEDQMLKPTEEWIETFDREMRELNENIIKKASQPI